MMSKMRNILLGGLVTVGALAAIGAITVASLAAKQLDDHVNPDEDDEEDKPDCKCEECDCKQEAPKTEEPASEAPVEEIKKVDESTEVPVE